MSTASFNGLLIASAIAVAAPILATSVRRVKLPSAVVEIVAGTVVGPSVLGWGNIDQLVDAIALLGLRPYGHRWRLSRPTFVCRFAGIQRSPSHVL